MDPRLNMQLQEAFAEVAFFVGFCWMVYLIAITIRRRQQDAVQKYVLDKFSSAQDFAQFVQSPAGQRYLAGLSVVVTNPRNTIITSIQTGCVVMFGGMGFLVGNGGMGTASFRIGWVLFLAGAGFLVSAALSYFMAKKVGWKEQDQFGH
jgi:hypothetical protein